MKADLRKLRGVPRCCACGHSDMRDWYEEKISAVASVAFAEMMREPWRRQYVWFTRGDLVAAPDRPPGMEIATPEPIPSDRTREAVRAWIWEKCRRVECLP